MPFNENVSCFSPQKSFLSVVRVLIAETVSLKTYSTLLETVYPANAAKFSIEAGTIERLVEMHESITVSVKED